MTRSTRHKLTNLVFLVGLAVTAIMTPVHGDAGTSEDVAARGAWDTIHVIQIFSYCLLGVGAMAYALTSGRGPTLRLGLLLLAVGSLFAGAAHIVDGPFRTAMIDNGMGDGDPMYEAIFEGIAWSIVVGYAFVGLGGALWAGEVASGLRGVPKGFAIAATVLYGIGAVAGTAELGLVPGIVFMFLALAWLWSAVHLGLEMRNARYAPDRPVTRGARVQEVPRGDKA